jgi:hypothetical protein
MLMLLQCYPTPPPELFVPAEHRLAAALCLVSLTVLLLRLLSRSRLWLLVRRQPNAPGALATVPSQAAEIIVDIAHLPQRNHLPRCKSHS